jgi:proteasome lid subunit RPN8/RPN11
MALHMTSDVIQELVRGFRARLPQEACAFVVADQGDPSLAVRVHWMANVSPSPINEYLMDDDAVRLAYTEFDQRAEEVLAVAHSHPTSEPVMSAKDRERAGDTTIAYLIVSLAQQRPRIGAWRVERFIGNTVVHYEPIDVVQQTPIPVGPWALLPGNYVRIAYQRTGKTPLVTVLATTGTCDGTDVLLEPDNSTGPRSLPLERIRSVHMLQEGQAASTARRQLRSVARALLDDISATPALVGVLARAFPEHIQIDQR